MDAARARRLVQETFQHGFDRARFESFLRELLNRFEPKPLRYQGAYIPDAFKDHVASLERIGTYAAPGGERVDLLVVQLAKHATLARARTALRNYVAHHLKKRDEKDAALVAFVSPSEPSWRFSYVRMEYAAVTDDDGRVGIRTQLTPARRLSYLVGEGESCHTAQSRFLEILQRTSHNPTIEEIEAAFSVEAVTKEFFEQYKTLFLNLKDQLNAIVKQDKKVGKEFSARKIDTVDFAKKLMGQIVFLYFLQKKGWLGVAKGQPWGTGPRDFIRRLTRGEFGVRGNIFNDILEPLFYDTLATERGQEAWCSRFKCRIPFLNGGLFEPLCGYDWVTTDVMLPDDAFTNEEKTSPGDIGTGILDVFDRYNFTVNEAEPLEVEVAIDPEMLGKVFENLLEVRERKSKGSFYTPREIVHYMCQESLINFLDSRLNSNRRVLDRTEIEALIHTGEQAAHYEAARKDGTVSYEPKLPDAVEKNARTLDKALSAITVCDPAIGSGAFPVGMMTEIVRARTTLTPYFEDSSERTPYHFKRHAIQVCLYGVDIDPGAVEIAKLRLWLSLVVDEEDVRRINPLPNLDFKIVVGNSLVGVEKDLFNSPAFEQLEALKPRFFDESNREKKSTYKEQIETLIHALTNRRETFDFEIYFSEVFHSGGGFDVVIANPPYVSVEKFARTAQQADWKKRFKTYASRGDVYCFFYERGLAILRDQGVLTFISSNKFQRAGYGKRLRHLLQSQRIRVLIDFCELPVFAASTDPMIVIVEKASADVGREFPVLVVKDENEFGALPESVASRAAHYKPEQLREDGWSLGSGEGLELVGKFRANGTALVKYVNGRLYRGIITGLNEAFVIDREARDRLIHEDRKSAELIKPWIRGKDIKRWTHEYHDLYVIIVRYGFHAELKKYPAILRHLSRYETKLKARGQCMTSRGGGDVGQHHWLELDNNPSEAFIAAFDEPKIVFNETSKRLHAYLDTEGNAINKTGFIILTPDAPFVLAVLNSTPMDWFFRSTFPPWGDPWASGRIQFRGNRMNEVPIPPANPPEKARLTKLAERAARLAAKGDGESLAEVERELDAIVCALFGLTPEEVAQIESDLVSTRETRDDSDDVEED